MVERFSFRNFSSLSKPRGLGFTVESRCLVNVNQGVVIEFVEVLSLVAQVNLSLSCLHAVPNPKSLRLISVNCEFVFMTFFISTTLMFRYIEVQIPERFIYIL